MKNISRANSTKENVERLARAAILVMVATTLSRIFGYVREMVVAAYFGAGYQVDAYRVAIQLPNLFRLLLADAAIASAFIPVFSSYLAREKKEEAWKITSTIVNLTFIVLGIITVAGITFAPFLIHILAPGFKTRPETFSLSVSLTRIMFPALIFMALSGIVMGLLNSYNKFFVPSITPVIWNFVIIGSVMIFAGKIGIFALAGGLVAATAIQFLIQLPDVGSDLKLYRFRIALSHPGVQEFLKLIVPIVASAATTDINTIVDTRFASVLGTGSVASLGYAIRLYLVPLGIFSLAISTVLFPTLSKFASLGREDEFRSYLSFGIRAIITIVMPVSIYFVVFSLPITRLLFERGRFQFQDSLMTASPFAYYSMGLVAISVSTLLSRAYYALKDSKTPFLIALLSVVVNYFGDWFFMRTLPVVYEALSLPKAGRWWGYPHGGIALSTSLVSFFQMLFLIYFYRRKFGVLQGRKILEVTLKTSLSSTLAAGLAFPVFKALSRINAGHLGLLISLTGSFSIFAVIFIVSVILFKVKEITQFKELVFDRLLKKKSG